MSKPYSSIEGLWTRDGGKFIIPGRIRNEKHLLVHEWQITEKVDGTNIRATYRADGNIIVGPTIGGRTDKANLQPGWVAGFLVNLPSAERVKAYFFDNEMVAVEEGMGPWEVTFYGEGYGGKIQSPHHYGSDYRFIGFDVYLNGTWVDFENARGIMASLGIPSVPHLGTIRSDEYPVSLEFMDHWTGHSRLAVDEDVPMEGIVAVPKYNLYDNRGTRLMWKLVRRDFLALEKAK